MAHSFTSRKRIRRSFGQLRDVADMPNLIEVQKNSYDGFLQIGVLPHARKNTGLQEVFKNSFPIIDYNERSQLEFDRYDLEKPKFDVEECRQRGLTYAAPLRVTLRLVVWDIDEDTGSRSVHDIKEQDVYIGDIPLMTNHGTFVINGTERVIVSQMHRSPGVFFDHDRGRTHSSGKFLYSARIIPYRGSWLDVDFDPKDILNVRIDRRRKLPVSTLLMALDNDDSYNRRMAARANGEEFDIESVQGYSREEILNLFYKTITYRRDDRGWVTNFVAEHYRGGRVEHDLIDARTGEVVAEAGSKLTPRSLKKLDDDGFKEILISSEQLQGRYLSEDVINEKTGLVIAEAGDEITDKMLQDFLVIDYDRVNCLYIDNVLVGGYIRDTLAVDKCQNRDDALIDIYRVMRPGEPPTLESAEALIQGMFFDAERYDLSAVGRVKMNARLGITMDEAPEDARILRREDVISIIRILCDLKDGRGDVDDIDHLGNRRVRSVGELLENQFRLGLVRMERATKERMGSVEVNTVMPHDLVNAKPVSASIKEFFGSSQLSQFMDQTNPLSEITHKRRVSALGPGGLTRERAGFEVRDVHPTHYGRICPIETPEGPNIGLINSLATYARVNPYGFIETPYRKVADGCVTDEVLYLSAMEEGRFTIAQANAPVDQKSNFTEDLVQCRRGGDYVVAAPNDIELMDVSPRQLVSVAAALIPFLENDDANRALMGSNMQRQAVPLMKAEAPLVGTGMESQVAQDSGVSTVARYSGVIDQVDATRIVVRRTGDAALEGTGVDIYQLQKFQRSNQSTCINQRPLVKVGDHVKTGDIIADGPATDLGELALGRNVLVAFMPWQGYNFEDSILISQRIVRDDVFTSIHIEEYEVAARDSKLGQEEITRDIPNVGEESLRNLDEAGIVYIGAEVEAGDVLVGKVTPKGESPMTPEERLLRAIFGEKAADVRDSSLRMPPGSKGTVVDVRVLSRRGIDKDERAYAIEKSEIELLAKDRDDERRILERSYRTQFLGLVEGQTVTFGPKGFPTGKVVTRVELEELTSAQMRQVTVADEKLNDSLESIRKHFDAAVAQVLARFEDKVSKVQAGDDLSPGVMKLVKVFVAVKRKLQPGDKMAGRHGNKGVISKIAPIEDMPYLEDGTHVDIVLNPLGVPSRMNVGQILETHLGWACASLGRQVSEAMAQYRANNALDGLRESIVKAYDHQGIADSIKDYSEADIVELGKNLSKGVPIATPVFDGAREEDINHSLDRAGISTSGQVRLVDGRTGEAFDRLVTVGYIYMLKLHHLVDDKLHARAVGPYSLVTQQPLGGKAQFGGQRFGEMEVWALEAYGAAYTLQEMLTVKSDDIQGRTKVYEAIVRGEDNFEPSVPESFNVLLKEIKALGLSIDPIDKDEDDNYMDDNVDEGDI
ncbi:MAG: DNA-directed RNA polymerase subunit beta [Alphaproteobacteria bacterium]